MGHRANLLIVENGEYELFYSHWCANTITTDLFWGPQYALRFIRMQKKVSKSEWLDDVWAQGGAIVDCSGKNLLLFGGEDIQYDIPLRRVYLEMLERVWSPWTVEWAFEGIAQLADYVGDPRTNVLSIDTEEPDNTAMDLVKAPEDLSWTECVLSIRDREDKIKLFPLNVLFDEYILIGDQLVKACDKAEGYGTLPLDDWLSGEFPTSGFHIDCPSKELHYWLASDAPGLNDRIKKKWRDWKVVWNFDDFETQLDQTNNKIVFSQRSKDFLQKQLVESMMRVSDSNMPELILKITEEDRKAGKDVWINSNALVDNRIEPSESEKQTILAYAIGRADSN